MLTQKLIWTFYLFLLGSFTFACRISLAIEITAETDILAYTESRSVVDDPPKLIGKGNNISLKATAQVNLDHAYNMYNLAPISGSLKAEFNATANAMTVSRKTQGEVTYNAKLEVIVAPEWQWFNYAGGYAEHYGGATGGHQTQTQRGFRS
ncbi:MAG: hypothetical protein SFX18_15920 [Pirellulales bacterium]|nr:hypothetical protein [Pirellulales bacterium]